MRALLVVPLVLALVLASLVPASAGSAQGAPLPDSLRQRVDSVFSRWNHTDTPGCSLGISQSGKPVYRHGYGMSDLQQGTAVTPASIFHVSSISKEFTAYSVALLANDVQRLIRRNPDLALKLLASLAERVSRTNERLLQQSFQTVAGRVASALLAQTITRQADGAPDEDILIRSTQAEIAHLAGTSRESCSRFLATLERAGIVTLGRGKVTVHDPARLRNYIH